MAVLNPSFEDSGTLPGEAEYWTLVTFTALERIAGFGPEPYRAWEDFERWTEFLTGFEPEDIAIAFFDSLAEGYEDFEDSWNNKFYLTELPTGHVITAPFSGGTAEDMESAWDNDNYFTIWADLFAVTGSFDGEPREDFEDQWRSNHLYSWTWSDVTEARAYFDAGGDPDEDFENDWDLAVTL